MVTRGKARTVGLLDAKVIGEAERQALYEAATNREHVAGVRVA